MAQVNLAQPQYGDIKKVQQFSKAVKKSRGTYGQPEMRQGPGRPSGNGQGAPASQVPGVGTPGQYTPQPIPPQHQQLLDSEAHLKDVMLRWQQRAQTAGAGPAIMHYYNLAVQNWKQAATAARYGTPFHPEA